MKILRQNSFSDKKKNNDPTKTVAGIGLGIAGGKLIRNSNKEGEISGRVSLYHGTTKKSAKSIKENGFDSSKSKSKEAIVKSDRNQVYLSKSKSLADSTALGRELNKEGKAETLRISLPYEELKTKQDFKNPEYADSTSYEEYKKKTGDRATSKKVYNRMSGNKGSDTVIIGEDISPKFVKGSKRYKRNSLKEISEYAKKNPKRFAKGTGKLIAGTGAVIGGTRLIKDSEDTKEKKGIIGAASIGAGIYASKKSIDNDKDKLNLKKIKGSELKRKSEIRNIKGEMIMKLAKEKGISKAKEEIETLSPNIEKISNKAKKNIDKIIKKSSKKSKAKALGKGISVATAGIVAGNKLLKKKKNGSS